MPLFICPMCAQHVPRRAPRCDHCDADLRKNRPVRSRAEGDADKHEPGQHWWRPRNVFLGGALVELICAGVAILSQEREAGTVYTFTFAILLAAASLVLKIARFKDAWDEGWEEVLWIMYRPFGVWHDDPYDGWYACLAGLLVVAAGMVAVIWWLTPQ